jgi:hypothetical protein
MSTRIFTLTLSVAIGCAAATIAQDSTRTPTPTARPAELVKLETQAATEIPIPPVPPGRAPEVKKVAETSVAVKRATWVAERLLPGRPEDVAVIKWTDFKVGTRGWVDLTGEVTKVHEGIALVRPPMAPDGFVFAYSAAADAKTVALRGEYYADRAITVDGREVIVLKEVVVEKADPAKTAVMDAARRRLEEAKAAHAQATAVLKDARKRAEAAVMEKALAAAEKQLPVSKDLDVEEQVKAKAKQQELAGKLAKEELAKIAMMYADTPVIDPIK